MARVLVTGAAGFIGSHLCEALSGSGHEVVGLDYFLSDLYTSEQKRQNWQKVVNFSPSTKLMELDLRQNLEVENFLNFDYVFHLAAMPGLALSWTNFGLYADCNVLGTNNLLRALDYKSLRKFIYISTSSVYGEVVSGDENSPLKPVSPYGVTKLAGENLVVAYSKSHHFEHTILRLFSVYGPRQRSDMAFNIFIKNIASGLPIDIFGDGTKSRANTYIADVIDGLLKAMSRSRNGQIYNICGSEVYSVLDVIINIEKILGKKASLSFKSERLGDQKTTLSVGSKASLELEFSPKTSLIDGLTLQCQWQGL